MHGDDRQGITPKVVSDGSSARQITDEYRQQLQLMQPLGEGS
ncbi:hypothetical protein [Pseudomonas aegrilactucae]|nr:hypothetical protein [Pseudomonas aegrilactucae]